MSDATTMPLRLGVWGRLSDRLNPILVRELQQAVKGRVFLVTVLLALLAEVVVAVAVTSEWRNTTNIGRNAFSAGLATLAPLLLFVVPMQAYLAMTSELKGGVIEQLLLSELRPLRIVAGKLAAAMVQFVLYLAVAAPLLTTSYVLRGVDLPTILFCLCFAMVFCVAATTFAIAAALQGTFPAMRPVAMLGMAFGLGVGSISMVAYIGSGEGLRDVAWMLRSPDFWPMTSAMVLGCLLGIVLLALVAQAFLAHAFENRSTGFRVFLLAVPLVLLGWMLVMQGTSLRREAVAVGALQLAVLAAVFMLFMVTELRDLSPRVRAHVPRHPVLALLVAPLLPGRDRGLLCGVLFALLIGSLGALFYTPPPPSSGGFSFDFASAFWRATWVTFAYMFFFYGLVRTLRGRLPETLGGNHGARFLAPLLVLLGIVLPLLFDGLVRGRVDDWHVGHLLNPFWTIATAVDRGDDEVRTLVMLVGGLVLLLQAPALLRGVREVLAASAARRRGSKAA
jgi:ABC-type transport system involved in cytochrome c biogenesis permease component